MYFRYGRWLPPFEKGFSQDLHIIFRIERIEQDCTQPRLGRIYLPSRQLGEQDGGMEEKGGACAALHQFRYCRVMDMALQKNGFILQEPVRIAYRTSASLTVIMDDMRHMLDTTGLE